MRRLGLFVMAWLCFPALLEAVTRPQDQSVPEWRLGSEIERVGTTDPLHRVAGAKPLGAGLLAIADAGNNRVVYTDAIGVVRSVGREGDGPGEFRSIAAIDVTANGFVFIYDAARGRVTRLDRSGEVTATVRLPLFEDRPTQFLGALSDEVILLAARAFRSGGDAQVYATTGHILRYELPQATVRVLEERPLDYHYLYAERHGPDRYGVSNYALPFFGRAHIATAADVYALVPLDSARLVLREPGGSLIASTSLSVVPEPFTRDVVADHREMLLRYADGQAADRIRQVFSAELPVPETAPAVEEMVTVGGRFWIRAAGPVGTEMSRWLVVSPTSGELVAEVEVPSGVRVLGGASNTVVLLEQSELGEEFVVTRALERP